MLAQFVSLCKIPGFSGGKIPEWEPVIVREGRREEGGVGREWGNRKRPGLGVVGGGTTNFNFRQSSSPAAEF